MAENNKNVLNAIQRLRMGITKESEAKVSASEKKPLPEEIEDFEMPSFEIHEVPTESVEELFAKILSMETKQNAAGATGIEQQNKTMDESETKEQNVSSMQAISAELIKKMTASQQENWHKLEDYIDNWVQNNQ